MRTALVLLPAVAGCIGLSHASGAQTPGQSTAQAQPAKPGAASPGAIKIPNAPEKSDTLGSSVQPSVSAAGIKPNASSVVMINGRPYVRPTPKEQFDDYAKNTYGWPALVFTSVRASVAQGRGKPEEWGQDWPGFGQRFGSAAATTAIDGNVRYGMEMLFKEDMRYIPCHGCSIHRKLENALLAEFTARHDTDGHRFFTLTPTLADMSGPMIANSVWIPGHTTIDGFIGSRLSVAFRIGGHMFTEFVLERRHYDPKLPD
jgi:hypothetical protein